MKAKVVITPTGVSSISEFHSSMFGTRMTKKNTADYIRRITEAVQKTDERYQKLPFFKKEKSHTFTALCFGSPSARWPQHTLFMVMTRIAPGSYSVSPMTESALPEDYDINRLMAEARMIYDELGK